MEIKIGGRTVPMVLTVFEMVAIQEEIGCTIGQVKDEIFGLEHNLETDEYSFSMLEDKEKLKKFGRLIRILGNAGLEEEGQKPDLTDKWVLRNIRPAMLMAYTIAVSSVLNDAMKMESAEKEKGPVDEVLEEQNRKKEPGSLPTGESAPTDSLPG